MHIYIHWWSDSSWSSCVGALLLLFCFASLRQGQTLWPRMTSNPLCSPSMPWTHGNPLASFTYVLGLQAWLPAWLLLFLVLYMCVCIMNIYGIHIYVYLENTHIFLRRLECPHKFKNPFSLSPMIQSLFIFHFLLARLVPQSHHGVDFNAIYLSITS